MLIKSRRDFLKIGLKSVSALGAAGALGKLGQINAYAAGNPNYRALVCIFLSGGNDGNNTIIPINTSTQTYTNYAASRQGLALPQGSLLQVMTKPGPNNNNTAEKYDAFMREEVAHQGELAKLSGQALQTPRR